MISKGNRLITVDAGKAVKVYQMFEEFDDQGKKKGERIECVQTFSEVQHSPVFVICWWKERKYFVTGDYSGNIWVWK